MNTTTPQYTPETGEGSPSLANFTIQQLERERDEAREELQQWKMLCAWGGTPEHIDQFIKGQQSRIHQAQDIEETCEQLERELNEARDQIEAMREAIKEAHEALDWATSNMNPPFAWEPFKKANAALTKLQPFIKP